MAVLAILAALVAPSVIKQVDRAAWTKETADLNAIGDALTQSILRTKSVPSFTNWASAVASQMSLPVSSITTNARRYARAFLIDPSLSINGAGLAYTQTTNGATSLANARVMIVSSLARALPASVTNGVPSAADFTNIWNAAENTVPAAPAFSGWGGTGDDLRIKKLNLEPLFYQLILVNHDATQGKFSIDGSSTVNVPTNSPLGWNRYYLDGTVLGLHDATNLVQTKYIVRRSISFIFESDAWRGQIQGGQGSVSYGAAALDFLDHAQTFFSQPENPALNQHSSQYAAMIAMYTFMYDYTFWATECPHFDDHGASGNSIPEYKMLNDQGQNSSGNIDSFTGTSGLLK